jgi:hypothetical protein
LFTTIATATTSYAEENSITLLPVWKNNTFYEGDTVIIKISVPYKAKVIYQYHISVNITKPDSSKIFIDDYVRNYFDASYYIELHIQDGENGTWLIDTYTEYSHSSSSSHFSKYNNGSMNFTVLSVSEIPPLPPDDDWYQIIPVNTFFASPNFITIDETGSESTTLMVRVKNLTNNIPGIFVRFYIYNEYDEIIFTDNGFTAPDGVITKNVPQNTFFVEGDYIVYIFISDSGKELMNSSGVIHVRYVAAPHLYPEFLNQSDNITNYFEENDEVWINWTWNLYKSGGQPDTISCKVKFISSDNQLILETPLTLNILYNNFSLKNMILDISTLQNVKTSNYTVVLETLSLNNNNYEMVLGVITINITSSTILPEVNNILLIIVVGSIAAGGIVSVITYGVVKNNQKKKGLKKRRKKPKSIKMNKGKSKKRKFRTKF